MTCHVCANPTCVDECLPKIEDKMFDDVPCKDHPDAPHGLMKSESYTYGRYVCECEFWEPENT